MKIAMLTSGGDCQGLNAAMRGVAKSLYHIYREDVTIFGILDGFEGLLKGQYLEMHPDAFSQIISLGGTILGTARKSNKSILQLDINGKNELDQMVQNVKDAGFDCLVILGGNGTHKTAYSLFQRGIPVVTLPKTIDNDLWGTEMTFGFQSAVQVAASVIDSIRTTADAHSRVFLIETMGHKVGWLTLQAGLASGADIVLIPEIPYNIKAVAAEINRRMNEGKRYTLVAVAEGALSEKELGLSKKERAEKFRKYPSIAYRLADKLSKHIEQEIRVVVPGHFQRGGVPIMADRVLATQLGVFAAELIAAGNFGNMAAVQGDSIVAVPLSEVAGKLKMVPPDGQLVKSAREVGIVFGD